jgi:hypothetical protein
MKLEFSRHIFEKYSNIICDESPVGAELFHVERLTNRRIDGQTMKITFVLRNFAKTSNVISFLLCLLDVSKCLIKGMVGICNINGSLPARNSCNILFGEAKEQKIS